MAKRQMLSKPKDIGGLGIINTRLMNECLIAKWTWKLVGNPWETWAKLLTAMYMSDGCTLTPRLGFIIVLARVT